MVILWGAFVRASGSGAGCGSHWPTCNGEVLPRPERIETLIEFTHRTTSGVAFILVLAQFVWAVRRLPRGHRVRKAAGWAFLLMVTEALVGAGLVLFQMVADNESIARAYWMAGHLTNTFALIAALVLTWWWAGHRPPTLIAGAPGARTAKRTLTAGAVAVVLVAVSGAVAALGDTLFPASSLSAGLAQDVAPSAHVFLRLRVWHPVLAMATALYLLACLGSLMGQNAFDGARRLVLAVGALLLTQVVIGFVNLALLAPIFMQLAHLLLADLAWMALVILLAEVRGAARAAPLEAGAL